MNKAIRSASAVACLIALALMPMGAGQDVPMTTLAEVSLGFPYAEDFDADDGGWTASPVPEPEARPDPANPSWEWGAPTSGPGFAASGNNVWATNLEGSYNGRECAALLSPPIDLTGASSASVSFLEWSHLDQSRFGSGFISDGSLLFATTDGGETLDVVDPDQGYDGPLSSTIRGCLNEADSGTQGIGGPPGSTPPAAEYSLMSADLSTYAGQVVQFVVGFGSSCCTHRDGWYIDDFTVTIDGVSTVEDFEGSDGGFTVVSTAQPPAPPLGWDWGVASGGPDEDSPLWATNTQGDYGHKECAWVESPEIDLGPAANVGVDLVTAHLSWDHWFRSNSLYAAGIVQIGVVGDNGTTYHYIEPAGGYPGKATGSYSDQLQGCLGEEAGLGAFSGFHDSTGAPMELMTADVTPFVGETITVRFHFASAWSTFNPTTREGWYVDDVEIEQRVTVSGPDVEQIVNDVTGGLSPESMQRPGWTTGGDDSSWAYGFDVNGDLVYATNPLGDHNDDECSWIQSPPIAGAALAADPVLTLDHWWHQYYSRFSGIAWNGGAVFASVDNGATWTYVPSDAYTNEAPFSGMDSCLRSVDPDLPEDPMVFGGEHMDFETSTVDLSEYTDASTVMLRFVQGSGIGIEREGWHIRGATAGGIALI